MLCLSCGAEHSSKQCPQSLAVSASAAALSTQEFESDPLDLEDERSEMAESPIEARPASRLIEFPGVTRRAVPQWRKDLSDRVREVQERKAREATLEQSTAPQEVVSLEFETATPSSPPQLELLPQAEAPEINPVLAAALRRIERAHHAAQPAQTTSSSSYSRTSTAVALARDDEAEVDLSEVSQTGGAIQEAVSEPITERTHNLVVVHPIIVEESEAQTEAPLEPLSESQSKPPSDLAPGSDLAPPIELTTEKPKPKRLILDDLNDPALSYLDSIGIAAGPVRVEDRASLSTRVVAAVLDVITVGFLSLPFAALIELQNGNWHQARIVALMGGIATVLMFLYATACTALTGRTLGMRLLSLRAVDVRNGLIPTGSQSAGRALLYVLSLATLGIGLLMAFARGEGKTVHDRLTRTAVVRD
jgi:uncharacterized RDD family membrane protein YckC